MSNVTFVTSFFDIGRDTWLPDRGFPKNLAKTIDEFFIDFAKLAKLENEIFVFTTPEYFDRIAELRADRPTTAFDFDLENEADDLRDRIDLVYATPDYQRLIDPRQRGYPKYWNSDYVVTKLLKATMVCIASIQAQNDAMAWIDFDYFNTNNIPEGMKEFNITQPIDKIHVFKTQDYDPKVTIHDIVAQNLSHIDTGCILASKNNWKKLEFLIMEGVRELLQNFLIDDDSLFVLLATLVDKDLFMQHPRQNVLNLK